MDVIEERAAALYVHNATVNLGRLKSVAQCEQLLRGRSRLRHVLDPRACSFPVLAARGKVAMEATGVYWKPVWAVLEDRFRCLLVNARHVKQVPGRKTDVLDAQWLCRLLEAGLLKPSLVPPKPIRTLRNLTRYRKSNIRDR